MGGRGTDFLASGCSFRKVSTMDLAWRAASSSVWRVNYGMACAKEVTKLNVLLRSTMAKSAPLMTIPSAKYVSPGPQGDRY